VPAGQKDRSKEQKNGSKRPKNMLKRRKRRWSFFCRRTAEEVEKHVSRRLQHIAAVLHLGICQPSRSKSQACCTRPYPTVDAGKTSSAHAFWIQGTISACLCTVVRPSMDQETLSPLREPTSAARPAVSSRIALLGAYFQNRIGRVLLWFSFQALVGKAGTLAHVGKLVGGCLRFWRIRLDRGLRHAVSRRL